MLRLTSVVMFRLKDPQRRTPTVSSASSHPSTASMGCASSAPQTTAARKTPDATPNLLTTTAAAKIQSKGKSKGKGKGKIEGKGQGQGKGKGKGRDTASKFQIMLREKWEDYGAEEDAILKRAYLVGHANARYRLRGQDYEYSFRGMTQRNLATGKQRTIRPPRDLRPPAEPLLPPGAMVVVQVPEGFAGKVYTISDPLNPGQTLDVAVPAGAKTGARLAVPVPQKGETAEDVRKRQQGFSAGAKVALVGAAAGAGVVGGVVLADHLAGGAVAEAVADSAAAGWTEGAVADAGEWVAGAADDVGAWAEGAYGDAGDWGAGAAEDAGEWAEGAWEDVGDWGAGAVEDTSDWLGGAGEDFGDFVTDLF